MKHFCIGMLALVLSLTVLVQFRVVDQLAYQIESGRLRAEGEYLVRSGRDESAPDARKIVETVLPAVVTIETESRVVVPSDADDTPKKDTDWWDLLDRLHDGDDGADDANANTDRPETDDPKKNDATSDQPKTDRSNWLSVEQAMGSGFVVDAAQGYVLTNAHVVDGAQKIRVTLADGRETQGKVLGSDSESDLAVLQIDEPDLFEAHFGDSKAVRTGDEVYAFGNPLGLSGSVSRGIVSAVNRNGVVLNEARYPGLLQTDAAISPGSSGGPLVNSQGEVVGVNSAIATTTGQFDGVGFAIPAHKVRALLADLIDGGPSMLGVWIANPDFGDARARARKLGWEGRGGALVVEVMKGLAAEQAGLLVNDVIVAVDGEPIVEGDELVRLVSARKPGSQVRVAVWRDGERREFDVTLDRKYAPR